MTIRGGAERGDSGASASAAAAAAPAAASAGALIETKQKCAKGIPTLGVLNRSGRGEFYRCCTMIEGYDPVTQALLGTLFTWGVTAAGSAVVFLANTNVRPFLPICKFQKWCPKILRECVGAEAHSVHPLAMRWGRQVHSL